MELVINIPDKMWERVKEGYVPLGISKHLKKGTPLPKGHGRLIDADALENEIPIDVCDGFEVTDIIEAAPTIIEADKSRR